jgi:hypothetical protein
MKTRPRRHAGPGGDESVDGRGGKRSEGWASHDLAIPLSLREQRGAKLLPARSILTHPTFQPTMSHADAPARLYRIRSFISSIDGKAYDAQKHVRSVWVGRVYGLQLLQEVRLSHQCGSDSHQTGKPKNGCGSFLWQLREESSGVQMPISQEVNRNQLGSADVLTQNPDLGLLATVAWRQTWRSHAALGSLSRVPCILLDSNRGWSAYCRFVLEPETAASPAGRNGANISRPSLC